MKRNRALIISITAVFMAVAALIYVYQAKAQALLPFSVMISYGGNTETVALWENEEEDVYVFLPSGVSLDQSRIQLNTGTPVYLDGKRISEDMNCADFPLNTAVPVEYKSWGRTHQCSLIFMQSSNVASLHIDTSSGNMDYIHAEKGNAESGNMRLYLPDGTLNYSGRLESIKGRGNYTWETYEKKPYSVKLESEGNLIGMGAAQKWILLANASDPSNMRNKIVYDFADRVGLSYSPESRWIDLYLNDEYVGLYLLSERNEIHSERIDIPADNSFLVSCEREDRMIAQSYPYIKTMENQTLRIHYPEDHDTAYADELKKQWQSVENALVAADGIDSISGKAWNELIDMDSWVRKYLMEEIFCSVDSCFISQFFYSSPELAGGKVFAGPVWDYDHSIGTPVAWAFENPTGFYADRYYVKDGFETPWFYSLCKKEEFNREMVEIYKSDFLFQLKELIEREMDSYAAQIYLSSSMDQKRWDRIQDMPSEVEWMKAYLSDRIDFLNSAWIEGANYFQVRLDQGFGGFYGYFAVEPGQCLTELPVFEDTETLSFVGWFYEDTNEPFDSGRPIYEDINIYAKWQDRPGRLIGRIGKMMPLGIIAVLCVLIFIVDIRRIKRNG